MKAYKGFDKDLKCRDFQYEIGKEYEEKEAIACEKGFHACENPLDVLHYYSPYNGSRYCEVEQSGEFSKLGSGDSKVASTKIKIGNELGLKGIIQAAFHLFSIRLTGMMIQQQVQMTNQWRQIQRTDQSQLIRITTLQQQI